MAESWKSALDRWSAAGLIDAPAAGRIRAFEAQREQPQKLGWPVRVAIAFGGVLLAAGILLFVEAHWDDWSPMLRFSMVLAMVGGFHGLAGGVGARFPALANVLSAVGTTSLGAGIFLGGQIFNLEEHWPGAFMLWALGAGLGMALLERHWAQVGLAAILTPCWLVGEWLVATERLRGAGLVPSAGLLLLAVTYFAAPDADRQDPVRRVLMWIGGLATIPCVFTVVLWGSEGPRSGEVPGALAALGWAVALVPPLGLALALRGQAAWIHGVAALWVLLLAARVAVGSRSHEDFGVYLWCAVGSIGLIAWGLHENRRERINLGVAAFGITVLCFYFANVFDKLGRSFSLIGLGVLFLVSGGLLERVRRRLVARTEAARA